MHAKATGKPAKITSDCTYHYATLVYSKALESKETSPCTNLPLNCPICPVGLNEQRRTFWKYNFIQHMTEEHLTEEGILASCPPELIVSTHITKSEELWMGIEPERTTTYRITNRHFGVHNSDDSVFNPQAQEVFEQRKRAGSSLS